MSEAPGTHDELKRLLAPFAVGVASSAEDARLKRHLQSCRDCAAELSLLEEGLHVLATADAADLPHGLEERIVAAARKNRGPRRSRSRLAGVAAVAAVALVIAVGAGIVWSRFRAADEELGRRNQALELLLREEGIALSGASAVGKLVPREPGAVFVASGLPEAPGTQVYQLWLKDGEQVVPVTTFESAGGAVVVELSRPFDEFDGALVTIEPEGGSRQPTGAPVVDSI